MKKTLSICTAAILALTLLLPAGIAAAQAPAVETVPPVTDTLQFDIGTPDCPVTALPTAKDQWPQEPPEDIATVYVWADEPFDVKVTTSFDYHHRGVSICDHWVDHQPDSADTETTDITERNPSWPKLRTVTPQYLYFMYYDMPGVYPFHMYAAKIVPVVTTISGVELATPEEQPDDGFALDELVALKPVWSVGTMSGDTFTEIPNLVGYPDGAGAKWAIEGEPENTNVIREEDGITVGDNVAVLNPPKEGGEFIYTATLVNTLGSDRNQKDMYVPSSPASLTVKWSSESSPTPVEPEPTNPGPEPAGPSSEPSAPGESDSEGLIPPETSVLQYDIGTPDCPVTELPSARDEWPEEPPADIPVQYIWSGAPCTIEAPTAFEYHHRGIWLSDHWLDRQPDADTDEAGVQNISDLPWEGKNLEFTKPQYLYILYYDMPGVYPFHCYVARIAPVAATVSSLAVVSPPTEPSDGYPTNEQVVVKPIWSVGAVGGEDGAFVEIAGLHGCPKNGGLKWTATDGESSEDSLAAIQGGSDISTGESSVVLVPQVPGGELTYTAAVVSVNNDPHNKHNLYVQSEPASLTVLWTDGAEQNVPIHSTAQAPYSIDVRPNLDGSGTILTGIPIGTDKTDGTSIEQFLSHVHAADGSKIVVKDSDGQPISGDHRIGTGCQVDVVDASGETIFSTTIVIRGDVLGTGMLTLAQLTRVAAAYQDADALTGPYKDAALLLSDTQNVTLTSLVALAKMLRSAA